MEDFLNLPTGVQEQGLLRVPHRLHDEFKGVCTSWRVPYRSHDELKGVCTTSWKEMMCSPQFYEDRMTYCTTKHLICLIQISTSDAGITIYDPREGTWERVPPIPCETRFLDFCELVSVKRKLVLFGQCTDQMDVRPRPFKAVFIYDLLSKEWRRGADMPTSRIRFACSVSSSTGLIYVAGGLDEHRNTLATAEAYDVEEDRWQILPPMTQNRESPVGVYLERKFMVISGNNHNFLPRVLRSAEGFDEETGIWNMLEDMWGSEAPINQRRGFACGNYLFLIGQEEVRKYDAHQNVWTAAALLLPQDILYMTCVALWRDRIFVSGSDGEGHGSVSYWFRPSTGEWTAIDVTEGFDDCLNVGAVTVEI